MLDDAAVIGAAQQLASETAAAVAKLHTELDAIRADMAAQGGYLTLSDSGDVTINAPPDMRDELRPIADNIESRAHALIHQASRTSTPIAPRSSAMWRRETSPPAAQRMSPPPRRWAATSRACRRRIRPRARAATPGDVKAWWDALSEEEQEAVKAEHPDWVGNRDGVPVPDRSDVNRVALDRELTDVQRHLDELGSREDFIRNSGIGCADRPPPSTPSGSGLCRARLDNAKAMKEALSMNGDPSKGYDPDRYLMLLEFPEGRDPRAAIAHGNPDTAEHVSVTVPGMDTHPTSLPGMVEEAGALREEAQDQLTLAGRENEQVAAIAWFGYDPPDTTDGVRDRGARRAPRQRSRT